MNQPISPPPVLGGGRNELPAYLSNGLMGLRVRDNPLAAGMTLLSGYAGEHAQRQIEAAASAPYPVAGDICLDGVWASDAPAAVRVIDQTHDFATAELLTRLTFTVGARTAMLEVLTFCSRDLPTLVCQQVSFTVDGACDLRFRAHVDTGSVLGRPLRQHRDTPGEAKPSCDGFLLWESAGAACTLGLAYATEFLGEDLAPQRPALDGEGLVSEYGWRAHRGERYRLRQLASLVPSALHSQPDYEAARLVAYAADLGFDAIRATNRACWSDLWKGRIRIVCADAKWQALADAAFYYLMSSTHASSPASTSIFGLATWHDYHYYYGHVMWDIETFCVPPLIFLQPAAAEAMLDYRLKNLDAARSNARLMGRRGLQFPWESAPSSGQEAAPVPGTAAWREDHVSLGVARAFSVYADVTGEYRFALEKAWPVLAGVCDWIKSRVHKSTRGYEIQASMGIAERENAADNAVFTNMSARVVLRAAISAAERLEKAVDPAWSEIASRLVIPMRGKVIISHDGYRQNEEKAATPDPLMGLFPLGLAFEPAVEEATLSAYLKVAQDYLGSPMLSALYGAWAARTGDRRLALEMMEEGYARFSTHRFMQCLEYREDVFPEQPRAGPFFANLGGFLMSLLLGFPRIEPDAGEPETWLRGPIVLPAGWEAIEVDRLWIRGEAWSLRAIDGEAKAALSPEPLRRG